MSEAENHYNLSMKLPFYIAFCKQLKNNDNKKRIIDCLYKQNVLTLQSKDYNT